MTERDLPELWLEVADGFGARLDAVRDEQWTAPTPCTEWDVRMLAGHAVAVQRAFVNGEPPGMPEPVADPRSTWSEVLSGLGTTLRAPGRLDGTFTLPSGAAIPAWAPQFGDLVVHTWDLARAIGADKSLPPEAVEIVWESLQPAEEVVRSSGTFGPRIEAPPGADLQTRLLAFTGRRA